MCQNCGAPVWEPCNCRTINYPPRPSGFCCPPSPSGCPIQLDFSCIIYHKNNNELSQLVNLDLPNGATLNQFAVAVDNFVGLFDIENWSLPFLRNAPNSYVVNTIKQFAEAVDDELADLQAQVTAATVALVANDSQSIDFSTSGTLGHTLTGSVKISADADNQLSLVADGLFVTPQTLSVNYTTKELSIVDGNTVDLSPLSTGVDGFLGNVTSDPTALDGQYWYRTDLPAANGLRIRVNGTTRTIPTT